MNPAATLLELRKHPRAPLKLPARVRWRGPLGMRMESTQTLDVSRNGIRVQRNRIRLTSLGRFSLRCGCGRRRSARNPSTRDARRVRQRRGISSFSAAGIAVAGRLAPIRSRMLRLFQNFFRAPYFRSRSRFSLARRIHDAKYFARRSTLRVRARLLRWRRRPGQNSLGRLGTRRRNSRPHHTRRKLRHTRELGSAPLLNPLAGMSAVLSSVAVRWDVPT